MVIFSTLHPSGQDFQLDVKWSDFSEGLPRASPAMPRAVRLCAL